MIEGSGIVSQIGQKVLFIDSRIIFAVMKIQLAIVIEIQVGDMERNGECDSQDQKVSTMPLHWVVLFSKLFIYYEQNYLIVKFIPRPQWGCQLGAHNYQI